MSGGVPKRAQWADDTDSDVDEAVPVASKKTEKKTMTSWADSDTESDVDNAGPPPKKLDAFGESESESESEEEEESEDDEEPPASDGRGTGVVEGVAVAVEGGPESVVVTGDDPAKVLVNLSRKERKALKQKELDDLDALLGEFGVEVASAETPPAEGVNGSIAAATAAAAAEGGEGSPGFEPAGPEGSAAGEGAEGAGGKKKKKKKKPVTDKKTDGGGGGGGGDGNDALATSGDKERGDTPAVVIQPITAALKNKGKKKPSLGKPAAAASKAAKEAAEKEAKKQKKKRDKTNFNQAPPGK